MDLRKRMQLLPDFPFHFGTVRRAKHRDRSALFDADGAGTGAC